MAKTSDPRLVQGLLTYDFFAFIRTLEQSGTLTQPTDWTEVQFPLAMVVFGKTDVVPWDEP